MYHSHTNVNNLVTKSILGIIEIGYTRTSIHVQIFYQSKTIQKAVSAKKNHFLLICISRKSIVTEYNIA